MFPALSVSNHLLLFNQIPTCKYTYVYFSFFFSCYNYLFKCMCIYFYLYVLFFFNYFFTFTVVAYILYIPHSNNCGPFVLAYVIIYLIYLIGLFLLVFLVLEFFNLSIPTWKIGNFIHGFLLLFFYMQISKNYQAVADCVSPL